MIQKKIAKHHPFNLIFFVELQLRMLQHLEMQNLHILFETMSKPLSITIAILKP